MPRPPLQNYTPNAKTFSTCKNNMDLLYHQIHHAKFRGGQTFLSLTAGATWLGDQKNFLFSGDRLYKRPAVAETGDRLATIDMGRKLGAVSLLWQGWGGEQ